jgi:hypothetical protein
MSTHIPQTQIMPPPPGLTHGELVPVNEGDAQARIDETKTRQFVDLEQYLNNLDRRVNQITGESGIERQRLITKMRRFYQGDFFIRFNRNNVVEHKKKQSDALYADPVLSAFIDTNVSTRLKSKPSLNFSAKSEDRVDKEEAASYAKQLYEDAAQNIFTAQVRERENKDLELTGDSFCVLYFDPQAKGTEIKVPTTEKRMIKPSFNSYYCPECGKMEKVGESEQVFCGGCGNTDIVLQGAESFEAEVETGFKMVPAGDVRAMFPDPIAVKVIGSKGKIADALVVCWDALVLRGVLEAYYPNQIFNRGGDYSSAVQQQEETRRLTSDDTKERVGGEQFEPLEVKRRWLSPLLYGGYTFPKETKLPNGKAIEAGTKMSDLYPDGVFYCLQGGKLIDIYPQTIASTWSHTPNLTSEGFHGLGSWDLIPLQEMVNELVSLQFAIEMYDSLSPTLYRAGKLPKKIPNKPGVQIPVSNLDDGQNLNTVMARVQSGGGTSQAAALREQIAGSMQQRYGSWSASGSGAPDIKAASTATGAAIIQENAMGRMAPSLALQAETEVERAYQILELRQQNWPEQMYEKFDCKVGGDAGRWFRECNVRRDIRIEVVPESYYPQTQGRMRAEFGEYLSIATNLGLIQRDPKIAEALLKRAGELYGRGIELEQYQNDRVEARIRLDRMRQVGSFLESKVPVYDGNGQPIKQAVDLALRKSNLIPEEPGAAVNTALDRHAEYIENYSAALLTSEGRSFSPFVRAEISKCIELHRQAEVKQAQYLKTLRNEAMIPDKQAEVASRAIDANQQMQLQEGQAEQAQQQAQQAAEMQSQQGQQGAQLELAKQAASNQLSAQDREHELQTKMDDREHEGLIKAGLAEQGAILKGGQ